MTRARSIHLVTSEPQMREWVASVMATVRLEVVVSHSHDMFRELYEPENTACVLVDLLIHGGSGVMLLRELRESMDPVAVVMLADSAHVSIAVEAMRLGASDFLCTPVSDQALVEAVQRAASEGNELRRLTQQRHAVMRRLSGLSEQEKKLLAYLVVGESNKTAARHLGLAAKTVENYRASIMRKTGAKSLAALVVMSCLALMPLCPATASAAERPLNNMRSRRDASDAEPWRELLASLIARGGHCRDMNGFVDVVTSPAATPAPGPSRVA